MLSHDRLRDMKEWAKFGRTMMFRTWFDQAHIDDQPTPSQRTELLVAALLHNQLVCADLLLPGADLSLTGDNDLTPLMAAVVRGHAGMVKTLLDLGCDPNTVSPMLQRTPLMYAARYNHTGLTKTLLARTANPEAVDKQGLDALAHAMASHQDGSATLLIRAVRADRVREVLAQHTDDERWQPFLQVWEQRLIRGQMRRPSKQEAGGRARL